jgi:hypothetical protein
MTKAMRLGVSALLILGGVGLGSFIGCSSDDEPAPVADTGTEEDTATDTGTADTGSDDTATGDTGSPTDGGSDTAETGPKPADRKVTLLFGSPDLGGKFACFGAFTAADPTTADPAQALGPIGIPTTADMDPTKFTPIPYGAVIPLPLDATASAALSGLTTVIYLVDSNPLTATPPTTCKDLWKTVRADTKAWKSFAPNTIKKGEQAIVALTGCKGTTAPATGECGTGNNFEIRIDKPSTTPATAFAGSTTGPKVSVQFINYSRYAGSAIPSTPPTYQGIDVYLQFRKSMAVTADGGVDDSGDATTVDGGTALVFDGTPVKIADNVKYGDLATVTGVQAGDMPDETIMVLSPHGTTPCFGGATCASTPIPLKTFLAAYKPVGGGFFDGQNQFFALTGGPVPTAVTDAGAPDPSSAKLRVPMGRSQDPTK